MKQEDHPRGLPPKERKEWHKLCDRLFELYRAMPLGNTTRKIIAGGDDHGNALIFFFGDKEECIKVVKELD